MATLRQERRERDATRAFRISVFNSFLTGATLIFSVFWQVHQKHSTDDQLGSVKTSIRTLTATVAPQLLKAIDDSLASTLRDTQTPSEVTEAFSTVESNTSSLRSLEAKLPTSEIKNTAASLEQALNLHGDLIPGWAAAAEMVSYRSDLQGKPAKRPDCFTTQGGGGWHLDDMAMRYHDCTLTLNEITEFNAIVPKIWQPGNIEYEHAGYVVPLIFLVNGTVEYSGGNLIPIQRLICQNCSFDLHSPHAVPPVPARALSQQLLLADLSQIDIKLPAS